jgi:outer membrane protein TolC
VNLSQPLLRDLIIDPARQQLAISRTNRDIADTRLRESVVHTTANVKSAYWNLVSARATVNARRSAYDLAQELVRVNKAKVEVGSSPPLDLVSAQAETAANQEQLIIAETAVKQAEDRLRLLIFDPTPRENWNVRIEAVDSPPVGTTAVDIDAAVTRALAERADLLRARKDIQNSQLSEKYAGNQRLPDVRLNASYQASGLGGTQVLRSGGFPGTIVGPGEATPFGTVLSQLFARDFPTWAVGVNVSYPIGQSTDQANYARARLERTQTEQRVKGAEARAIQQVRDAGWKIEMNAKRIETTRASRELAEQRLDAERKRFEVGMSTSFLVIQAQRDLAQATTNELSSVLAYDLSLVDFEALQEAGPATQGSAPASGASVSQSLGAAPQATTSPAAATAGGRTGAGGVPGLPGVPQGQ